MHSMYLSFFTTSLRITAIPDEVLLKAAMEMGLSLSMWPKTPKPQMWRETGAALSLTVFLPSRQTGAASGRQLGVPA
jgi:hypothetical protein